MLRQIFQRALIARFIPLNHARSDKRDDFNGNFHAGGMFSRLEIESGERNSESLTVHVDGFAGNDTGIGDNQEVPRFSAKF